MRLVLAALLMSLSSSAHANDAELRQKIVGTWTLVSVVYEDQATKELTPVLGEKPRGRQIATADGRWLALVTAENRPVPKTDEDRARALTSMIAYTGRYRVEDGKVVTKVEAAWNEAWVGGEQTRFIRFEGDRLFIESTADAAPQCQQQGGEGDRDLGSGEVGLRRVLLSSPRKRGPSIHRAMLSGTAAPKLSDRVYWIPALPRFAQSAGMTARVVRRLHRLHRINRLLATEHARDVARALGLQFLQRLDRIECRVRREDYIVTADQR